MSTFLRYYDDDYLSELKATVQEVNYTNNTIILDATTFFPTGGHQWCDQGWIKKDRKNNMVVTDVKKDEKGIVRHFFQPCLGHIAVGDKVTCTIYWQRRLQHMQLHTAQHLFSAFSKKRFGIGTGRADFSPKGGLMVMDTALSWEQMALLEEDVNKAIRAGHKISRTVDARGRIRIEILGVTVDFCGGTHVRSTAEINFFKITNMADRTLTYQVAETAKRHAIRIANYALQASAVMGIRDSKLLTTELTEHERQRDEACSKLTVWMERVTQRQIEIARQTAIRLGDTTHLHQLDLSHKSKRAVKNLVKKELLRQNQIWVCMADKGNILIYSSCNPINANQVLELFKKKWQIQGGGNEHFAQGGPVPRKITEPLKKVAQEIIRHNTSYRTHPMVTYEIKEK